LWRCKTSRHKGLKY